jgi:predicted enzyme related to lactoylglutathione lyase
VVPPAAGRSRGDQSSGWRLGFQIISSGWLQLFESEINNPNPAVVRFESDDIEASRMQALSLGTDVGEIETVPEAVRYFEFRDPFGNQLSFYQLLK